MRLEKRSTKKHLNGAKALRKASVARLVLANRISADFKFKVASSSGEYVWTRDAIGQWAGSPISSVSIGLGLGNLNDC